MDLLIALGTSTAYLYSAFVVFFPDVLPGEEKNVYFDVSAIIIAFVLFGKYMEELIKKTKFCCDSKTSRSKAANSKSHKRRS